MSIKYIGTVLLLFCLLACAKKAPIIPEVVLPIDEFSALMMDIRLAETNYKLLIRAGGASENFLDSNYRLIYALHGVNTAQVDTSFKWYSEHPALLKEVDQQVLENFNRLQ